jgi:hypothetical protein
VEFLSRQGASNPAVSGCWPRERRRQELFGLGAGNKGNIMEGIQEINGWLWSKNKEINEIGWIPIKKITNIGVNMEEREVLIKKIFSSVDK